MTQILVPTLGESVSEATVATWLKKQGDTVALDEPIVELETDKVTLEVNAPAAGTITSVIVQEGEDVEVGALLGEIGGEGASAGSKEQADNPDSNAKAPEVAKSVESQDKVEQNSSSTSGGDHKLSPAVLKMVNDNKLDADAIPASGRDGRLTKEDVQNFLESNKGYSGAQAVAEPKAPQPATKAPSTPVDNTAREERVKMTRLRQSIAKRLKGVQETAAILTTFNEVDMGRDHGTSQRISRQLCEKA